MLNVFLRAAIMYIIVIVAVRIMGKRQIGELQPGELVVTIMISELASIPLQDVETPLVNGLIPVFTLLALEIILSAISLMSFRFRQLMSGHARIVIRDGVIDQKELRHLRITIDDLMEQLRQKDVFDVNEVAFAIVETNGALSVLLAKDSRPATVGNLGIDTVDNGLPVVVINDGHVVEDAFAFLGTDQSWLDQQLGLQSVSEKDVFLMLADRSGMVNIIKKVRV